MQLVGKLMDQTWENGKKPNFGLNFGSFGQNLGPKYFFLWVVPLLDVRHCCKLSYMQFQVKLMNQTWENDKKNLVSGTILACLTQVRTANFFWSKIWLYQSLHIIVSYHHVQYHGILWRINGRTDRRRRVIS